ncbi:MAG: hypothetical protein IJO18_00360 [Alphaproteobacteria bacterium]|nr:hypothetical protein [Alphaproteobacteria bacterium]
MPKKKDRFPDGGRTKKAARMRMFLSIMLCLGVFPAFGNTLLLDDALRATYTACVGIDEELADLKQMAGINTAITAVGAAAGAGATVVGVVKVGKDQKAEELEKILEEIRELSKSQSEMTEAEISTFMSEFNLAYDTAIISEEEVESELDKTTKQSKNLGNWRTGLMAGSTATNLAGAIIAGTNQVKGDLESQINACKDSVENLRNAIMQARMDGTDISEAQSIVDACGDFEYSDLSKINTRGKGAVISAGVGTATGLVGTVTSAMANTDTTRNDNSEAGKTKEKNLNTASNILAGTTTAASVTATVFNATQIKAIKQVAQVASKCTGVLK